MNYKKIDRDHLMEGLTEYLSKQYMENIKKKEDLIQRKYELEEKKLKAVHSNTSADMVRMKQVFSPLAIEHNEQVEESSEVKNVMKEIRKVESSVHEVDIMSTQIKSYIQGLKETYFIVTDIEEDDEKVKFLPAFYELLDHIQSCYDDILIEYTSVGEDSDVLLTFSYLKGFQNMIRFLFDELLITTLKVDFFVEKNKIFVQFITSLELIDSIETFKQQKTELENQLSREFSITRWQESSIILQAIIQ